MSRLNVGILGCGAIAATMANTVRKTKGFCMYAAASRNLDKATGFGVSTGVIIAGLEFVSWLKMISTLGSEPARIKQLFSFSL